MHETPAAQSRPSDSLPIYKFLPSAKLSDTLCRYFIGPFSGYCGPDASIPISPFHCLISFTISRDKKSPILEVGRASILTVIFITQKHCASQGTF